MLYRLRPWNCRNGMRQWRRILCDKQSSHTFWRTLKLETVVPYEAFVSIYRVSQEECARRRENVPYVKVHRYNPKHLYPKLKGYGDNGRRKVWSSCGSTYCTCSADALLVHCACPSLNVEWVNVATALRTVVPSCKKCAVSDVKSVL
jgi:hypothetical protein